MKGFYSRSQLILFTPFSMIKLYFKTPNFPTRTFKFDQISIFSPSLAKCWNSSAETFIRFVCLKLERLRERVEGYERIFKR